MKDPYKILEALIPAFVILFIALSGDAYGQRVFTRTLTVEVTDKKDRVKERMVRRSDIIFSEGKIIEKVLGQTGKLSEIKDFDWVPFCLDLKYRPVLRNVRYWCALNEYRGSEPLVTEVEVLK